MKRAPADQPIRDRVASDFDTTLLLEAGAGTGKTTVLVARIVAMVRTGWTTIDRIAAITFTEKAAGELKVRLREALEAAAGDARGPGEQKRLREAALGLDRAMVTTIHSFALGLLKERPFEAGLDPEFRVAADVRGERSFDAAWDDWIDRKFSSGDAVLVDALHLGVTLDDLRAAARAVVAERDILGRTVAESGSADPEPLRQAVRRTVELLRPLRNSCRDEADGAWKSIERLEAFAERCSRAEGHALRSMLLGLRINPNSGNQKAWAAKAVLQRVKADLKSLKERKEAFEKEVLEVSALRVRNRLTEFLGFLQDRQREDALVDFQGLLLEARNVLANDRAVRRYFQRRFDAILIDEFQDTDPLQVEIAFFLAEDDAADSAPDWQSVRLKPGKLFLVGDPKQSIYRFRRADLGVYERAKERVLQSGGDVLPLRSSFRSVPSIVAFVNERFRDVFRTNPEYDPQPIDLLAERPEIARDGARVLALGVLEEQLPADPREAKVDVLRETLGTAIAGFVDEVTRLRPWSVRDGDEVRPARPGDIGLLVRNLTGIEHVESALRARRIGYRLVGGKAYHQRGEVAALRAVLLAIDNAADRLALVEALRSPFFGVSDGDLARFVAKGGVLSYNAPIPEALQQQPVAAAFEALKTLHRQRRIDPPSAVVRSLFERTRALPGFLLSADGEQAVANLWKISEIAQAYEAAGPATLRGFVRFLAEQAEEAREEGDSPVGDEAGQNVEILSVHRAKGLEYPIVVIADILSTTSSKDKVFVDHAAGEGWLEIGKLEPPGWGARKAIEKEKAEAEERRLLYVAATRARDHLVLPVLPASHDRTSWATLVLKALAQSPHVTPIDNRPYFPPPEAESAPRPSDALEGGEAELHAARAAHQAWDDARRARLEQGRTSPLAPAAVTDVARETEAPAAPPPDPGATAFGELVHALLARTPLDGSGLPELATALAPDLGLDAAQASAAADLVARTLKQPLFDRVRKADRVLRETPIAATLDGQRLTGVMDLAFLEAGRWTVVEYKTGAEGSHARAAEQLRLYGRALQASTTLPVVAEVFSVA